MQFWKALLTLIFVSSLAVQADPKSCQEALGKLSRSYDYVVVGSGAGGAVVASRLAQAGNKVLIVEAGGDGLPINAKVPAFHGRASETPEILGDYHAKHYSDQKRSEADPKNFKDKDGNDGVFYPRGTGLGGSTQMNAMITVLAHRGDFDAIAQLTGDHSWRDKEMQKYWTDKIENNRHHPLLRTLHKVGKTLGIKSLQNIGGHGFEKENYLQVSQPSPDVLARVIFGDSQLRKVILTAEKEMRGRTPSWFSYLRQLFNRFDPNDAKRLSNNEEGLVITPLAVNKEGRRNGPRGLLLKTQEKYPENIDIATHTLASKVLLDENNRAVGVSMILGANLPTAAEKSGNPASESRDIEARKGVVVAGGSFETPALLMRSGIGPKEELEKHGIPVLVDSPEVGKNLHDRYEIGIVSQSKKPFNILSDATFSPNSKDPEYKKWQEKGKGLYATNGVIVAMIAKSDPSLKQPDLYIFGVPGSFPGYYHGYSKDATKQKDLFTWLVLKGKTENRGGTVELNSADPHAAPKINFKYFEEGKDKEGKPLISDHDSKALVKAVELIRKMNASMPEVMAQEILPGKEVDTPEKLEQWAKDVAWGHHATGTAAIGKVVDGNLKVKGTDGLYVADASVFPDIPGFFIVSPTYMVAEKASDSILRQAKEKEDAVKKEATEQLIGKLKSNHRSPKELLPGEKQLGGSQEAEQGLFTKLVHRVLGVQETFSKTENDLP